MMKTQAFVLSVLLLAALVFVGLPAPKAYAAALIIVNTTADELNSDGDCSLREAIQAANTNARVDACTAGSGDDTIVFDPNLGAATITLTMGTLPAIVSGGGRLIIHGGGVITISGANTYRVLVVNSGADLTLQNLTIANGRTGADFGGGVANAGRLTITNSTFSGNSAFFGGGVLNSGTLTITGSTFSGNSATGVYGGGGVYNAGSLTITNSTFSGNSATNSGGGVYNAGSLTITNSTFSGNSATDSGGGVYNANTLTITNSTFSDNSATGSGSRGGGVFNASGSMLTITNSTFSGNGAFFGGGVYNSGSLTITNSTFSGNIASSFLLLIGSGGGIYHAGGTLTITNSTFSGNSASISGGGIYVNSGAATLKNTIVANSINGDCVGSLSGANLNNLIEDSANACGLTDGSNGNIIGQDPNLGTLIGSPAYFPLLPVSPAIDAGTNDGCPSDSQNGVARPQDGNGDGTATCDIGAFEQLPPARYVVNTPNDNTTAGDNLCTLREAILA
ncbi:right-handed parallel beta-helix repeat-containing protein, partial [Caldilinea sp.]|uniref:right-handed parallel beta-helix repeat-containing protein n=2 Tax=Caldilinea TaxID=233191 RepID=UPI002FDEB2C5